MVISGPTHLCLPTFFTCRNCFPYYSSCPSIKPCQPWSKTKPYYILDPVRRNPHNICMYERLYWSWKRKNLLWECELRIHCLALLFLKMLLLAHLSVAWPFSPLSFSSWFSLSSLFCIYQVPVHILAINQYGDRGQQVKVLGIDVWVRDGWRHLYKMCL